MRDRCTKIEKENLRRQDFSQIAEMMGHEESLRGSSRTNRDCARCSVFAGERVSLK